MATISMFDTTRTLITSSSEAKIYGRFNVDIDFSAAGAISSNNWSNTDFSNNVDYITLQIFTDSARTNRLATYMWLDNQFTASGNWYSTKSFSTARKMSPGASFAVTDFTTAALQDPGPMSTHHFGIDDIPPPAAFGTTYYIRWTAWQRYTTQLGMSAVRIVSIPDGSDTRQGLHDATHSYAGIPRLSFYKNLNTGANPDYWHTGVRITNSNLNPNYRVDIDIDGGAISEASNGDNWYNTSISATGDFETLFQNRTGIATNINSTTANRFAFRIKFYNNYLSSGSPQDIYTRSSYNDGELLKGTTSWSQINRTTDINGNALVATRPATNNVTYAFFIIQAVIIDKEEKVWGGGNSEIVFGEYWSAFPNGDVNSMHAAYVPPLFAFDENSISITPHTYEYVAAPNFSKTAKYNISVRAASMSNVPEYAVTDTQLLEYTASKVRLQITESGSAITDAYDTINGTIDESDIIFFLDQDVSSAIPNMWKTETTTLVFSAYDANNAYIGGFSKVVVLNNNKFSMPIDNSAYLAGYAADRSYAAPGGYSTGPVTVTAVRYRTAALADQRKAKRINVELIQGGFVRQTQSFNRYSTTTGVLTNNTDNTYLNVTDWVVPENVNIYSATGTDVNEFSTAYVRFTVYGFDSNGNDYQIQAPTSRKIWYGTRKNWTFNSRYAGGFAIHTPSVDKAAGEYSIPNFYVYTDDPAGNAHWFKIYVEYRYSNGVLIGSQELFQTAGVLGTDLSQDNTSYYYALGNSFFENINSKFQSVYKSSGYLLDIKVQALDNLGNVIAEANGGAFHRYNFSANYGIEAADLLSTSVLEITEDTSSSKVGYSKYFRPLYRQQNGTGQCDSVSMRLYYKDGGVWQDQGYYFSTGFGSGFTGHYRSTFIKATSFNNYKTKVANNESYEKIYLADLGSSSDSDNSLYSTTEYKADLYVYDDMGNVIDSALGELVTNSAYNILDTDGAVMTFRSVNGSTTNHGKVYYSVSNTSGTYPLDYLRLEVREKNNTSSQLSFNGPVNGSSHWRVNSHTNGGDDSIDISSLLGDRYSPNTLQYRVRALASGVLNSSGGYYIDNGSWTDFSASAWTYNFNHSDTTLVATVNLESAIFYVQFKGTDSTLDIADKIRLRLWIWDGSTNYTNMASNKKMEAILNGVEFSSITQTRVTDENGDVLNMVSVLNNSGISRYTGIDIIYELAALKPDGSVLDSQQVVQTIPAAAWAISSISGDWNINTWDETQFYVNVFRANTTDTVPYMMISMRETGRVPDGGTAKNLWYNRRYATQTLNSVSNSTFEQFLYTTPSTYFDRYRTTEFQYRAYGQYLLNGSYNRIGSIVESGLVSYYPWWKLNSVTSSVTESNTQILVDSNLRGLVSSANTRNPTNINYKVIRSDTNTNITGSVTFASANVDNNTSVGIDISSLFTTQITSNTSVQVEWIPDNDNDQLVFDVKNISKDPVIATQIDDVGAILDDNGNEYIAISLGLGGSDRPDSGYLQNDFTLEVDIGVKTEVFTIDSTHFDNSSDWSPIYLIIPTDRDISQTAAASNYTVRARSIYSIQRGGGSATNVYGSWTSNETVEMITHRFPTSISSVSHNFSEIETGSLVLTFDNDANGNETGYNGFDSNLDFSTWFLIDLDIKEIVTGSLSTPYPADQQVTKSSYVGGIISWSASIPDEANYQSTIEITATERHVNYLSWGIGNDTIFNDLLANHIHNIGDLSGASFSATYYSSPKVFTSTEVVMNDLESYPNVGVVPNEVVMEDIAGEYALSGKKLKFKIPLDLDNYFTNAEPYFGFGIAAGYLRNSSAITSNGSYIDSNGRMLEASYTNDPAKSEALMDSAVYVVRDFTKDGDWYTFNFELDITKLGFQYNPDGTTGQSGNITLDYKLLTYSHNALTTWDKPDAPEITYTTGVNFGDVNSWSSIDISSVNVVPSIYNSVVEPNIIRSSIEEGANVGEVVGRYDYSLHNEFLKPYSSSRPQVYAHYEVRNLSIEDDNSVVLSDGIIGYHTSYESGTIGASLTAGNPSALNVVGYDPRESIFINLKPNVRTRTDLKTKAIYSKEVEGAERYVEEIEVNYADRIIPQFNGINPRDDKNTDELNNDNTRVKNKIYFEWIEEGFLGDITPVFGFDEPSFYIYRRIRQGDNLFSESSSDSPSKTFAISSVSSTTNVYKATRSGLTTIRWDDFGNGSGIDLAGYVNNNPNFNINNPYVFEYEIVPVWQYGTDSGNISAIYFHDKSITTVVAPDEFPIGNNGITNYDTNYNDKHSIEVIWDYEYDENVMTLHSLGADIYFELYYFYYETSEQSSEKEMLKPKRRRLQKILDKQTTPDTWELIDKIKFSYPDTRGIDASDLLGSIYKHSYVWRYEKTEDDSEVEVVLLVTIDDSNVSDTLSQHIQSRGVLNTKRVSIKTLDRLHKNKMVPDMELKFESLRHMRRELEYVTTLEQIPFTVTRKKAKPRGSNKPYSSST